MNLNKPILNFDLDGVLADFEGFFLNMFGRRHDSMSDKEMWKVIGNYGTFFYDLPVMDERGIELVKELDFLGWEVNILTACPRSFYTDSALQKKEWVRKHIGPNFRTLPVMGGKNKHLFMHKTGDILIDDYDKNLIPWTESGGLVIHHKDWAKTEAELNHILENCYGY